MEKELIRVGAKFIFAHLSRVETSSTPTRLDGLKISKELDIKDLKGK